MFNVTCRKVDFQDCFLMGLSVLVLQLMLGSVEGEELMPHRAPAQVDALCTDSEFPPESAPAEPETTAATTPIRKLSRNRGLVLQEQTVVEDSPEKSDESRARATYIRKGKRKIM